MGRPNILTTSFVAQDYYSANVRKMTAQTAALGGATAMANRNMQMLRVSSNGLSTGAFGMFGGSAAILGTALALGAATKAAVDFRAAMGNVSTIVDTSVESMDAMSDSVLQLSRTIPKPVNDLTEALYQIRSAGIGAADAMNVLRESGKLGAAGLGTATNSANIIVAAMNTFRRENLSAADAADILFKTVKFGKTKIDALSQGFGQAAEAAELAHVKLSELQAMTATVTNLGVPVEQAQTQIEGAMRGLIKPTTEMREILTNLSGDAQITGDKFIEMSGGLVGAFKKIIPEAQRLRMDLPKVIGRGTGFYSMGLVAGEANEAFNKINAAMTGANQVNGAFDKQMQQSAQKIQVFKNNATELGVAVGDLLIPPLNDVMSVLTPVIHGVTSFAKENKALIKTVVLSATAFYALKAASISYNAILGITAALTADVTRKEVLFNRQLAATPGYAWGANTAMTGLNATLSTTLSYVTAVVAGMIALIKLKEIDRQDAKAQKRRSRYILEHAPKNAITNQNASGGYEIDPVVNATLGRQYDSLNFARDSYLQNKRDQETEQADSVQYQNYKLNDSLQDEAKYKSAIEGPIAAPKSAAYAPGSNGKQNVTITVMDASSGGVKIAQSSSGSAAAAVPIEVKSTTSRKKPGIA